MISDTLNRIYYEGRFSNDEMARAAGVSGTTMSRARSDELDLRASQLQRLSVYLCRHGDTRLAACLMTPDFLIVRRVTGEANGKIEDDACRMAQALGGLITAHEGGNPEEWRHALTDAHEALECLGAEGRLRFAPNA